MTHPAYWYDQQDLEKKMLAEYSSKQVERHLEFLTKLTRRAGTDDERRAADYIKARLDEFGVEARIFEVQAYISMLKDARLEILHPVQKILPCLSGAFTPTTPVDGVEGELVCGAEINQSLDLCGKIALIGGPKKSRKEAEQSAQAKSAAAKIYITPGKERAISVERLKTAWGNPTPETIDQIPKIPAISICNEDGRFLVDLCKKGAVRVKLTADCLRDYRPIHLPVGIIEGAVEPEKFVLFGGHYCSWFRGATDNAAGNALMLETARVFAKYRKSLGRGVRFAWWSGHEQGTFAGSTWYADSFWDDIRDNAIAYLTLDGLGRIGSSGYECRNTEEIRNFHEAVVRDTLNLQVKSNRITKTGDQSFHGMGLPSFTGKQDLKVDHPGEMFTEAVWYSHSAMDTPDKLDIGLLESPFKVNTVCISRLCNSRVLPFEFVDLAENMLKALDGLQAACKSIIDLSALIKQTQTFKDHAVSLNKSAAKNLAALEKKKKDARPEQEIKRINNCLMKLSRILIPAFSTRGGKYRQDPAGTPFTPFPNLQPLNKLGETDPNSQKYRARTTQLLRERNKISDAIALANGMISDTLNCR